MFVFFFFLLSSPVFSQFYNLPNDYSFSLLTERELAVKDSSIHSGTKPYIHFFSQNYSHVADTHRIFKYIKDDPALDLVFYKHLLRIEPRQANFKLRLDPLLNFEQGRSTERITQRLGSSTRGFIGSGMVGNAVYFESLFAENQSSFPHYLDSNIRSTMVVPGQGRWKQFKAYGFDYAFSSGFVSIQASKHLNLQVGHGKHKMGYGYRSLLLSDNAFNYPYARITQQWLKGRLQYTNIYAVLMNLVPAAAKQNPNVERLFQKKAASFQYLSVNPASFLNIGLFQGMIWQAGDDRNRQHLDAYYFNPLLFTNLIPFGLSNKNNILIGADVRVKITNRFDVYGQLMADDLGTTPSSGDSWGFQGGLHYFDAFGIRNLFLQGEFNHTSKGSYTSPLALATDQSYSHYGQSLAFTPGNGSELVLIADYKWKRFFTSLKYNYQDIEENPRDTYNLTFISGRIGYLINPAYNLNVSLGVNYRMQNFYTFNAWNNETAYIYVGVKTSLYNLYYDF